MSTPSNSKNTAKPKPKRPLSGYNLFYRYKRNKILEATARPNRDNEAVIRAVLMAPPGLEGVSPTSPLFRLCAVPVDEFRATVIRKAMEGRLFPNENVGNRLHRKLHGMGFLEMGRMMREMWGQADELAKDVFRELAEVGRVRYRRLVAEYKLSSNHPEEPVESSVVEKAVNPMKKKSKAALPATNAKTEATAKVATPSPIPQQAPSSSGTMLEARSVWAARNPPHAAAAAARLADPKPERFHRPDYGRQVSMHLNFQGIVPLCRSCGVMEPDGNVGPANDGKGLRPSYVRKVSREPNLCDNSLLDPLPTETNNASAGDDPGTHNTRFDRKWGKRASTDVCSRMGGAVDPPFPASVTMGDNTVKSSPNPKVGGLTTNSETQQILLRNEIRRIQCEIARNNTLLPPGMRVHPHGDASGENTCLGARAPSSRSNTGTNTNSSNGLNKRDVSLQDFMQFIGNLDEAIDVDAGAINKTKDRTHAAPTDSNVDSIEDGRREPVFEKPSPHPWQSSIPMPAAIELKTNRARMA